MDIDNLNAPRLTLNKDVWMEILLFLPAKSLTRFRSVCKSWLSLISSDQFCRLHVLRHPKLQPSLILQTLLPSQHFYLNPLLNNPKLIPYSFTVPNSKILNSSKGLLLLESGNPVEYCVYNPTTKQSRKISLPESNKFPIVMGLALAFDPWKSPHYKIVCVRAKSKSLSSSQIFCEIEVYDSQTRTWRLCLESFTCFLGASFSSGVHCNNVIYWYDFPENYLYYYSITENVIGNIPCAKIMWDGAGPCAVSHCQLQESNGHLYDSIIVSHLKGVTVTVYELKEDYSEWLVKYRDEFSQIYGGQIPGRRRRLSFMKGDEGGTSTLITHGHVPGTIEWYSFSEKRFEELVDLRNQPFYSRESMTFASGYVFEFGESLAPV